MVEVEKKAINDSFKTNKVTRYLKIFERKMTDIIIFFLTKKLFYFSVKNMYVSGNFIYHNLCFVFATSIYSSLKFSKPQGQCHYIFYNHLAWFYVCWFFKHNLLIIKHHKQFLMKLFFKGYLFDLFIY